LSSDLDNSGRRNLLPIARDVIKHAKAGTIRKAEDVMRLPASNYTDSKRFQAELEKVIKRVPIILGPSCEISNPGDFKTINVAGISLILTRDKDGKANALINVCSHRGACLTKKEKGNSSRFTCPYHGWNFSNSGELLAISAESDFGKIEKNNYGLKSLPIYESAGLIWAIMDPESTVDIPNFLSGYDKMLETFSFSDWVFVSKRTFEGPNWKIAYDGYLEYYHVPILHRETFGIDATNRGLYFSWGPHQHIKSPATDKGHIATETLGYLAELIDKPEDEWDLETMTYGVWTVFPTTSIASFDAGGRGVLISQILPGKKVDESITTQYYIMENPPSDPVGAEEQFDFFQKVVMNEDYATGASSQPGLKEGVIDHVLFGRNEQGNQHFHKWVDKVLNAKNDNDLNSIFLNGVL
jgi:phenylpropionate dioxygenase-like ring-hydroxylating dioxygenase large terminal subunit